MAHLIVSHLINLWVVCWLKALQSVLAVIQITCMSIVCYWLWLFRVILASAMVVINLPSDTSWGIVAEMLDLSWRVQLLNWNVLLKLSYVLFPTRARWSKLLMVIFVMLALVYIGCWSWPFLSAVWIFKFSQGILVRVWHRLNILN